MSEVHTLSSLAPHPNVLRLLGAGTQLPNVFLVVELMESSVEALLYGGDEDRWEMGHRGRSGGSGGWAGFEGTNAGCKMLELFNCEL